MTPPLRRTVVLAAVALVAATVLVALDVLDATHAYAGAGVVAVVAAVWGTADRPSTTPWPQHPSPARPGGRHDVADLGWAALGRDGRVTERVVRRVRALAVARLTAHGVDPADPASGPEVERLLGRDVVAGLRSTRTPTVRTLHTWLDAIDRLGPDGRRHP